jgi:hypothetical protein
VAALAQRNSRSVRFVRAIDRQRIAVNNELATAA